MWRRLGSWQLAIVTSLGMALAMAAPSPGVAAVKFTRLGTIPGTGGPVYGFARADNGPLHIVYPTSANGAQGLTAQEISSSGAVGPQYTALPTTWDTTPPGLVALPGNKLEAIFGSIAPSGQDGIWSIESTDGGTTWSTPAYARSGPELEALSYSSPITAKLSGLTPVLTVPQAGNLVIQSGLGIGAPVYQVNTSSGDGDVTVPDTAADATGNAVVASWDSLAGSGGDYLQRVAPTPGVAQHIPGLERNYQAVAGRDSGPGVFAPYTADSKHVRLLRYGGGTEAVGTLKSVTANNLGVATGPDGRIWVMWGSDSGDIAVTRSNKAVTKFEPIQHLTDHLLTLDRLSGDGRLGPLDLLVDEIADTTPVQPTGVYHARVLPLLSAAASVKANKNKGKVVSHTITVTVTDAGDAVSKATVFAKKKFNTNKFGVTKLVVPGPGHGKVKLTINHVTYQTLVKHVTY